MDGSNSEGDSSEEEKNEEENRSHQYVDDDMEEHEPAGRHEEGFLSALSKETLKPRKKVRCYTFFLCIYT